MATLRLRGLGQLLPLPLVAASLSVSGGSGCTTDAPTVARVAAASSSVTPLPEQPAAVDRPSPSIAVGSATGATFLLVNRSRKTLYIDSRWVPLTGKTLDGADCLFVRGYCYNACSQHQPGEPCGMQCERPDDTMQAIPSGGTWKVPWDLVLRQKSQKHCSDGASCFEEKRIPTGEYLVLVDTYDAYACRSASCEKRDDGALPHAKPEGPATRHEHRFRIPVSGEGIVVPLGAP